MERTGIIFTSMGSFLSVWHSKVQDFPFIVLLLKNGFLKLEQELISGE